MAPKIGLDGKQRTETMTPGSGEPGIGRFRREGGAGWTDAVDCVVPIDEFDRGTLLETEVVE